MSNVGMTMCPPSFVHVPTPAPAVTVFLPEKMELQYCMHNFDQWGSKTSVTPWQSVERVKIDMDA